ncbi:WhiB family transcriptional regulator [Streptomyces tsukubensis]|uniref:WhiB family transcriptional regulator n=1 Tax=Streptomyces tsukubensis TaxID=83656 RepID=UPI0036BA5B34
MKSDIRDLMHSAHQGDWAPLLQQAEKTPRRNWADSAQCVGEDPDSFVLTTDDMGQNPEYVRRIEGETALRALRICDSCPLSVAARCLTESLRNDERFGIRAGLLAAERSKLRQAWVRRIDLDAVSAVLGGERQRLSKYERRAVIARVADDRALDPGAAARGLGISRDYLLQLARAHRKKQGAKAPVSN